MPAGLTAVVDHGLCNLDSIARALEDLGATVEKTRDPRVVEKADRVVLPGVGAFGAAMRHLTEWRLAPAIKDRVAHGDVPFLGICLGMQLMAARGLEYGEHDGLGLVPGVVRRLEPATPEEQVPHIGWNEVEPAGDAPLFQGVPAGSDFYFVHSFHLDLGDPAFEQARTPYCGGFTSAVRVPGTPILGTQFHPEKSQRFGQAVLRNFLAL